MSTVKRAARFYLRRTLGSDNLIERKVMERRQRQVRSRDHGDCVETQGRGWAVVRSKADPEPRRGLYLFGACEMPSLFRMTPMLAAEPRGTVGMHSLGHISFTRPDMLLQTLGDLPTDLCQDIIKRLNLDQHYFDDMLFEPEFTIPNSNEAPFPKSAVVLSMGPALVRTVYKHKETGVLVDPGGWWLSDSLKAVKDDDGTMDWFQKDFVRVGRQTPETWAESFAAVVEQIRARYDTEIFVFNALSVEPGDPTHSYAVRRNPEGVRRRRFVLALTDVSRQLGVHIIDADRILKGEGIEGQIDFAHFPTSRFHSLAAEGHRILRELDIV